MLCGQNFLLMTQVWGCIFPSLVLGLRAQLPGIGLPAVVYYIPLPEFLELGKVVSVSALNRNYQNKEEK